MSFISFLQNEKISNLSITTSQKSIISNLDEIASIEYLNGIQNNLGDSLYQNYLDKEASDTYFDPTPAQTVEPEDRNFTHPLSDLQLKRTTPKIYERKRDVYVDSMSDEVQGIHNREDEVIARLEEIDWEIDNIIKTSSSSISKIASLTDRFIQKIKERFFWAIQEPRVIHYNEWDDNFSNIPIVYIAPDVNDRYRYVVYYAKNSSAIPLSDSFENIHDAIIRGKEIAGDKEAVYVISKTEEKAVKYSSLDLEKTAWQVKPTSKIQIGGKTYIILNAFKNAPNHILRNKDIVALGFRWQYFGRLVDKGYVQLIARGLYKLTQKGLDLLEDLNLADTSNIYPFEKLKENIQPNQIWKDGKNLYYYISKFPVVIENDNSIAIINASTGNEEGPYTTPTHHFVVLRPENIPFILIKQNPSRRIASKKEQVIITYEGFPDDVKEFIQDHFKNLIEKYPDLHDHIKSVKIRQAERPPHYPKTTGAEYDTALNDISVFIPIEDFLGKLRRGLVHELTHAVQLFLDGKEEGIPGMPDSLPDEYYTGDLYLYWKNPLEEHAYSVENEFKRKYKVASLLIPDLLLWDPSANQIKEGDTVSLRLYNIVLGIVLEIGIAKNLLHYDTNGTLQESMDEGAIKETDLCAAISLDEEINGYPYETAVYPLDELELYSTHLSEIELNWNLDLPPESIIGNFQIGDKIRDSITSAEGVIKDINYLDSLTASPRTISALRSKLNKRIAKGSKEDPNPLIATVELFNVYDRFSNTRKPSVTVYRSLTSGVVKISSLKFSNYDDYTKGNEKLFEERYNNYGDDGGKMFWTSSIGQRKRFEALLNFTQQPKEFLQKASILDVGCGYGDFISFVKEKYDIDNLNYAGTELVSQMIPIAQQKHPNNKFELRDIVKHPYNNNSFDLVIGSGLFALNHPKWDEFVYQLVNQMFQISRKVVAVNFLSGRESDEQFKYTTPKEVYKILSKITSNVRVENSYLPDDFTFYLYKDLDISNLNWNLGVDIKEGDEVKDSAGDKYRVIKVEEDGALVLEDIFVRSRTSDYYYHVSPEHVHEFEIQKTSNLQLNWVDQAEDDLNDFLNTIVNYIYENTSSMMRMHTLGKDEITQKKAIRNMITMVDGYMTVNAYDLWEQGLSIDEIKIQINDEVQYWLTQSAKVM